MTVRAALRAVWEAGEILRADRLTHREGKHLEKSEKKHQTKKKIWVDVTVQPEKKRGHWTGHATFYWQNDPKKEKHSQVISPGQQAKLSIRSKKLFVKPVDGEGYYLGDDDEEEKQDQEQDKEPEEEVEEKKISFEEPPPMEHPKLPKIKRPKGWREEEEPELTAANADEWAEEHTARTLNGSLLLGTHHIPGGPRADNEETKHFEKYVVPNAIARVKHALEEGKPVTFINEGGGSWHGDPAELTKYPPNAGNEQWAVASRLERKFPGQIAYDTWDDKPVDVADKDSPIWETLTNAAGGSPSKARAAMAVFLAGQGDKTKDLREQGLLTPESEALIKEHFGVDMEKLSKKDRKKLYDTAFPGDTGQPPNEWSMVGEVYNAARQKNLIKKIKNIEAQGGIAVALAGASHAWNLKPVLDGA